MIALVDCNNFYASCERVFRPDLNNKPVAVLSNNDGCIIARSAEVKALNVPMGAPLFKWRDELDKHGVHIFSANFSLYGDLSGRVMSVLRDNCPVVEVYSIDEAFLDLSLLPRNILGQYCRDLRNLVLKWTGIPVSIGVAPTKTLAKLANNIAKKKQDADGCWLLMGSETERYRHLSVGDVWGVGKQYEKSLNDHGVNSVYDMKNLTTSVARMLGSVNMERTVRELNGEACLPFELGKQPRQRIIVSRSFGHDVTSFEELRAALASFAYRAGEKLRNQNSRAQSIEVFVSTNSHKDTDKQYRCSLKIPFDLPSNDPETLSQATTAGLKRMFKGGYKYKRGGVMLNEIMPENIAQLSLFTADIGPSQLGALMDGINKKMGANTVKFASTDVGQSWRMKQNMRSPKYTTQWDELPIVS